MDDPLSETPVQSGPQHTPLARLESAERELNRQGERDPFTAPDHETVRAAAELVRTRALAVIAQELAAFNSDRTRHTSSGLHLAGLETHDKARSERGDSGPVCGGSPLQPCVLPWGHRGAHRAR